MNDSEEDKRLLIDLLIIRTLLLLDVHFIAILRNKIFLYKIE